ncbi:MAG: methyl-accepting chemotaxis protein [Candidatus Thiodiazotropha sp.]
MFKLRNLTISRKLWLLIMMTMAGFIALTLLALGEYHRDLMLEKAIQTRTLVESTYHILTHHHAAAEKGIISHEEAQTRARTEIGSLRYDDTNYFWINDMDAHIVMHPIKPELDGKDLSGFTDPLGKHIFLEFAAVAKKHGEGAVSYQWPKPGMKDPVQKISYVKGFTPWGWVIGTGIYVDDVETAFWNTALTLAGAALLILLVMMGLSIAITRSIVTPICHTTEALQDIAMGEGDLTRRLDESGQDEISDLSKAFNLFTTKICDIIVRVTQVSTRLATAAEQLSTTSAQTHDNISQQQSETHQVASAVTEMAATVKEIAQSADAAAGSARDADNQAQSGKQVVEDVMTAIHQLSDEMSSASEAINLLATESENIGSVSDVISGITEQTSLLALNAAIEAARAGEQGRGFAVVADEVRSLASRTQQATTEIREMIEKLQRETHNAVDVIHRSRESTHATVDKARGASETLDRIVSSVGMISDRNTQIASASEEQSAVAHEIDRSVVQISRLSEHSEVASQQITQATAELAHLGESLREMISQFKTG